MFFRICLIALLCLGQFACVSQKPETDHLTITVPYNPETLDPHGSDTLSSIATGMLFYEGLVTVDANLKVVPALASQWENPDDLTWILHLRPNVEFHNGKKFTSKDVLYSIERVRKNPNLEMGLYARSIAEVHARDPLTVVIKTERASSVFLNKIRMVAIVPEGTTDADLNSKEFGTGPYQLKSFKPKETLSIQRYESYWGKKPDFQSVDYHLARSPEQSLHLLESDQSEIVQCNSKLLGERLKNSKHFDFVKTDSLFVEYISLNLADDFVGGMKNPFHEKSFREAIHHSIDRAQLVNDLPVYAVPALQPIPVFVFGFNPAVPNPSSVGSQEISKKLQEAGWSTSQKLPLYVRDQFKDAGTLIAKQLASKGIQLDVKFVTDEEFFEKRKKHEVLSYVARYACTTGDASDLYEDLLYSPDREGLYRHVDLSRYSHPSINAPEGGSSLNLIDHRREGLQALMSMMMEDLILIPLFVEQDSYAVDKRLIWSPRYDSVILAQEVRKKEEPL